MLSAGAASACPAAPVPGTETTVQFTVASLDEVRKSQIAAKLCEIVQGFGLRITHSFDTHDFAIAEGRTTHSYGAECEGR